MNTMDFEMYYKNMKCYYNQEESEKKEKKKENKDNNV